MFKFLLLLAIVVFIVGKIIRLLLKYAVIGFAYKHGQPKAFNNSGVGKTGEVKNTRKSRKNKDDQGEYIDYEIV